jgi:hypothetical protein
VLHGTQRTLPVSQPQQDRSFQGEAFAFTWLQLQKALDRLVAALAAEGGDACHAPELRRLRGIGEQVRCRKLLGPSHAIMRQEADWAEQEVW